MRTAVETVEPGDPGRAPPSRSSSLLDVRGAVGYKAAWLASYLAPRCPRATFRRKPAIGRERSMEWDRPIDTHELPVEDGLFYVVVCSEVLEHVSRLEHATRTRAPRRARSWGRGVAAEA